MVMKILFDQGTPAPLRYALRGHLVATAHEMGWAQLANGDLLNAAEASFDAFVTTDQNLRYQQNLRGRKLAILILSTTRWPRLQRHLPEITAAVDALTQISHMLTGKAGTLLIREPFSPAVFCGGEGADRRMRGRCTHTFIRTCYIAR